MSTYHITECTEPALWDARVLTAPQPHVLQSWSWGEIKAQTGWHARRLLWMTRPARDSGATPVDRDTSPEPTVPKAAAAMLVRAPHPRLPIAIAYVPKGPLLDWTDVELVESVLDGVVAEARRLGALFVKIDPDVRADAPEGQSVTSMLKRRGWRFSAEQIQYRNSVISDLTQDEEVQLAAMKPKWRYNIRLAERRGVTVRDGALADLPAFYAMYRETGARDDFLVRPFNYYRAIWERFLSQGMAHLLLAEFESEPIAGLILFRFGQTAWYFYGASTARSRELMPNHALQWAALRWAKAAGCTRYDWWGAPDVLDENDPMWGVYRFKQGFGGEFVPHIGAWDYPTSRPLYWGYTAAMPRILTLMRKLHR